MQGTLRKEGKNYIAIDSGVAFWYQLYMYTIIFIFKIIQCQPKSLRCYQENYNN